MSVLVTTLGLEKHVSQGSWLVMVKLYFSKVRAFLTQTPITVPGSTYGPTNTTSPTFHLSPSTMSLTPWLSIALTTANINSNWMYILFIYVKYALYSSVFVCIVNLCYSSPFSLLQAIRRMGYYLNGFGNVLGLVEDRRNLILLLCIINNECCNYL